MKNLNKIIITATIVVILIGISIFVYFSFFHDETALTVNEREWLKENGSAVIQVDIPSEINIFGINGSGVFFDFFENFEIFTESRILPMATKIGAAATGNIGFTITEAYIPEAEIMYQDHYVLVSNESQIITSYQNINDIKVGIIETALPRVQANYSANVEYITYADRVTLTEGFKNAEVNYIIVPLTEYLDTILENGYYVAYHFSDLIINYYLQFGNNEVLNSIISKFYARYMRDSYEEMYYSFEYSLFVQSLGLTQAETDNLTNRVYNYAYVPSAPFQDYRGRAQGGIAIQYLEYFSRLSGVEFEYKTYNTYESLIRDFNGSRLDLIFNDTSINTEFYKISTSLNRKYYVIAPFSVRLNLNHLNAGSFQNEITTIENSNLHAFLTTIEGLKINTVLNERELIDASSEGKIIAVDAYMYDYYVNREINNYSIRFTGYTNDNYSFQYASENDAFNRLFKAYANILDPNLVVKEGLLTFSEVSTSNIFLQRVAIYTLVLAVGAILTFGVVFLKQRDKKIIKMNTKIKKDDKLKYIDVLTSLKNRNYLSDQKESWNQNTIYPQSIIVLDLNKIKYLNDTYGSEEGDSQIKAAANVLIKTQLDNTEILRTDGNEFIIYLVGYNEKQILNYIKKLVREFKDLPYEYGAAFGFSMIIDDLKLIDDAINEALIQMRENKENLEAKTDEERID